MDYVLAALFGFSVYLAEKAYYRRKARKIKNSDIAEEEHY